MIFFAKNYYPSKKNYIINETMENGYSLFCVFSLNCVISPFSFFI